MGRRRRVYILVFGLPIVILSSVTVVREFFKKKSANFSDRPNTVPSA